MKELQEFERYLAHLGEGMGHADRQAGLRGYCTGLMAPLKRKSVEPMAAHLGPSATRSRHQSLHHFVADSAWSDEQMLLRVAQWVVPARRLPPSGPPFRPLRRRSKALLAADRPAARLRHDLHDRS